MSKVRNSRLPALAPGPHAQVPRLLDHLEVEVRRLAMWIVWNIPCGRLAPHLLGFAMSSKPVRADRRYL